MSTDAKIGAWITVAFLALVVLLILEARQADRDQRTTCTALLAGVTPSDSVRVYRAQPKCLP